jgi:hypothetical protein
MRHVESRNIHSVTVRARPSSGTDDREGRAWIVSERGRDRVGAVHHDVIRTDLDRDARVVTSVTQRRLHACQVADLQRHDPVPHLGATDDHAADHRAAMVDARGRCIRSPPQSLGQGRSSPSARRQSLDTGDHRAITVAVHFPKRLRSRIARCRSDDESRSDSHRESARRMKRALDEDRRGLSLCGRRFEEDAVRRDTRRAAAGRADWSRPKPGDLGCSD